jgi:23S rRNA (adenine2503-C2)-methyltransferase
MKLLADPPMHSQEDASVNWVFKGDFPGFFEARYVRRYPDRFIVYLSSQSGCQKACRFCHLTQSGQTKYVNADLDAYLLQAEKVLDYYQTQAPAEKVHFNFMARGELFANELFLDNAPQILQALAEKAIERGLLPEWKLSSIMPAEIKDRDLARMLTPLAPDIYYSIYSVNEEFRRRWLPKALPVETALSLLKEYQHHTRKIICLHWAMIKDQNDREEDMEGIIKAIKKAGLRVDINFVRYNPFSPVQGEESPESVLFERAEQLRAGLADARVKLIPRVGFDVKASCGMFVGGREPKALPVIN